MLLCPWGKSWCLKSHSVQPVTLSINIHLYLAATSAFNAFVTPLLKNVQGSTEPPLQVTITATSMGPIVKPDVEVIPWGPIPCLTDAPRGLRLSNPGKIPAPFKVFFKSSRLKFRADIREGVLAPSEASFATRLQGTKRQSDSTILVYSVSVFIHQVPYPFSALVPGLLTGPRDWKGQSELVLTGWNKRVSHFD